MPPSPLPIDPVLPAILETVRRARAAVITATPGAGKTTRVPPALAVDGPVIVLQPRRVAARSLARRVAEEQGWTVGREVGWHVRFERQFGPATCVLFATEGILTARLQQDPLLTGFTTIVLDEFHERSIHADLGIALARQSWLARSDLRVVIMSATLDTARASTYLDGCPVIDVPGALHPIEVRYETDTDIVGGAGRCLRETRGDVLCFLPGAGEIDRVVRDDRWRAMDGNLEIVPLHGSLDAAAQDRALDPGSARRVILATNLAETSLTVPRVSAVVDAGLQKVARYDPDRAVDSLETERITQDAADQRAGRAGRLGPGLAIRLWNRTDRLRPHREPEVLRVDLSGTALEILGWGGDPRRFEWFEAPPLDRLDAALELLVRLGAIDSARRLTSVGRQMQHLPISPRLSAIVLAANGARSAALACALLSERHYRPNRSRSPATTSSDLVSAIDQPRDLPGHVITTADALQRLLGSSAKGGLTEADCRRALFAGYPDRVGRRRAPGSPRVLLASGHGASIGPDSGVREAEFLIALDVTAGRRGDLSEAQIRMASAVDRDWLVPTHTRVEHTIDAVTGVVRAVSRDYYDAIVLVERPAAIDPAEASRLLVQAFLERPLSEADDQLVRRIRFAGLDLEVATLAERAALGRRALGELTLAAALLPNEARTLADLAPDSIPVPSGRRARLAYQNDGTVVAEVKLQELFGLADTPRIGARREPVLLSLLAPNGRPVQVTRDLRSFWERTYPEVRKELRGRYPRHPWPEDPWSAQPTARTTRSARKQ